MKRICECGDHCFGEIKRRPSASGMRSVILVDAEMIDNKLLWTRGVVARGREYPYALMPGVGQQEYVHRIVMNAPRWIVTGQIWRRHVVDHINHDTLDNRTSNLRVVGYSQNAKNRRKKRRN